MTPKEYKKIQRLIKASDGDFGAVLEALDEVESKMEEIESSYPEMYKYIQEVRSRGERLTEDEMEAIKEFISDNLKPVLGVDYNVVDGAPGKDAVIDDEVINKVAAVTVSLIKQPENGVTPRKGVDYFTEAELDEIVSDTIEAVTETIKVPNMVEVARGLESLQDSDKIDSTAIKGLITMEMVDQRALSSLDQRTQFLISKVSNLAAQVASGGGGGGGAVDSVFGRTGVVTAQNGDYTATQITNTPAGSIASTTVQGAIDELDTEVSGKLTTASNLSDVPSPSTARTNLGISSNAVAGDVTGTIGATVVQKVNGVTISGTPAAGQVPIASSSTAAAWGAPSTGKNYIPVIN